MPTAPKSVGTTINRYCHQLIKDYCADGGDVYEVTDIINRMMVNFCIKNKLGDYEKLKRIEATIIESADDIP